MRNKGGFTLTELVVVMFLLGLVAVICTSVSLMVNRSQQKNQIDAKGQTEIVKLQKAIEDWLMLYDKAGVSLSVTDSNIDIITQTAALADNGISADSDMRFEGGALWAGDISIAFSSITGVNFSVSDNTLCCSVHLNKSNYIYKFLHTMRAASITAPEEVSYGGME